MTDRPRMATNEDADYSNSSSDTVSRKPYMSDERKLELEKLCEEGDEKACMERKAYGE